MSKEMVCVEGLVEGGWMASTQQTVPHPPQTKQPHTASLFRICFLLRLLSYLGHERVQTSWDGHGRVALQSFWCLSQEMRAPPVGYRGLRHVR